jgi:hypothetical protein
MKFIKISFLARFSFSNPCYSLRVTTPKQTTNIGARMNDLSAVNAALNEGRTDEARELLREFLKTPDAETFFAASRVAVTDQQKRDFLQKAIELDPFHTQAHKALEAIAKPVSPSVFPPLPTASAPSMPPPPVATRAPRRIPRAGFAVLGVVVVLGVIGGGLFVASNNGTRNSIIPAAFVAATPTRRPGAQTSVTQTRLAQIAPLRPLRRAMAPRSRLRQAHRLHSVRTSCATTSRKAIGKRATWPVAASPMP